jgi:hypothetical protein
VAQTLLKHSSSRAGISNRKVRRNARQTNDVIGSHVSISKLARICQHWQMADELTELLDPERLFLSTIQQPLSTISKPYRLRHFHRFNLPQVL